MINTHTVLTPVKTKTTSESLDERILKENLYFRMASWSCTWQLSEKHKGTQEREGATEGGPQTVTMDSSK